MTLEEIKDVKFFRWKKDEEDDKELQIFKVDKIDYSKKIVTAFRYYDYESEELTFTFSKFFNDEIEVVDPKPIEEEEKKQAEELREWQQKYEEELKRKNEAKVSHFKEFNSPFQRGQEIELLPGYPKKALDFSTKEDRYYLDDCKIENGELVYSLMTVGTRKHREDCTYIFYTTFSFKSCHFKLIDDSFYKPIKNKYSSGIDWK